MVMETWVQEKFFPSNILKFRLGRKLRNIVKEFPWTKYFFDKKTIRFFVLGFSWETFCLQDSDFSKTFNQFFFFSKNFEVIYFLFFVPNSNSEKIQYSRKKPYNISSINFISPLFISMKIDPILKDSRFSKSQFLKSIRFSFVSPPTLKKSARNPLQHFSQI